jgi:hypothetical protein
LPAWRWHKGVPYPPPKLPLLLLIS